jgi:hypothetical protein
MESMKNPGTDLVSGQFFKNLLDFPRGGDHTRQHA